MLNPELLKFTNVHKWWHIFFMQTTVTGYIHSDKVGYVNNFKECKCSVCGFVKRVDKFYLK
jgi:hypothetical protein